MGTIVAARVLNSASVAPCASSSRASASAQRSLRADRRRARARAVCAASAGAGAARRGLEKRRGRPSAFRPSLWATRRARSARLARSRACGQRGSLARTRRRPSTPRCVLQTRHSAGTLGSLASPARFRHRGQPGGPAGRLPRPCEAACMAPRAPTHALRPCRAAWRFPACTSPTTFLGSDSFSRSRAHARAAPVRTARAWRLPAAAQQRPVLRRLPLRRAAAVPAGALCAMRRPLAHTRVGATNTHAHTHARADSTHAPLRTTRRRSSPRLARRSRRSARTRSATT
jgi:hypothetical protein